MAPHYEELKYCRGKQSIPSCSSCFHARDASAELWQGVTAAHLHALPCWEFLVPTQARRKGEAAEMNLGVEKSGLHPSYILYNAFSRSWAVDLTRDPSEL